jgi:hypothetical protein
MSVMMFCDERQKKILKKIRELTRDFYRSNDNTVTYAITGLLQELTNEDYCDGDYLVEKATAISVELEENAPQPLFGNF